MAALAPPPPLTAATSAIIPAVAPVSARTVAGYPTALIAAINAGCERQGAHLIWRDARKGREARLSYAGVEYRAARVLYEVAHHAAIPTDHKLLRLCDVPRCVEPACRRSQLRTGDPVEGDTFGALMETYRLRLGLSRNALARQVGADASYLTRISRGQRIPPRRHVVEALARALRLRGFERSHFLVAAGYAPVTAWTEALDAVARLLDDPAIAEDERAEFARVVTAITTRWHQAAGRLLR